MPRIWHPAACAGMPFAEKGSRERWEEMESWASSYSSLAAWVPPVGFPGDSLPLNSAFRARVRASHGTRTHDLLITNEPLYQLS